jgi:hypothetical protein
MSETEKLRRWTTTSHTCTTMSPRTAEAQLTSGRG